jgi:trehalose 6-phosphate phosphatase
VRDAGHLGGGWSLVTEPLLDRLPELAREISGASHFLLGLDFDGTLAPIVADPATACMPDATRAVFDRLASLVSVTVAVISGRAAEDLRTRVGLNVILAGNHGLEIIEGDTRWSHPEAVNWQPVVRKICGELASRAAGIPGALVEDKGLTASFHYRNVASADLPLISEIASAVIAPYGDRFFLRNGKKVFEILPRTGWDKGSAVLRIIERLRETLPLGEPRCGEIAVCYIGDDTTDERVFRRLPCAITVRVGKSCPTLARFRIRDTAQVAGFLNWLRCRLTPVLSPQR